MKTKPYEFLIIIISLILALICIVTAISGNNQAFMPVPLHLTFTGEYSLDGENWQPYTEDSEISSYDGELHVRLSFDETIFEGAILNYFSNHVGVSMYLNDELIYKDVVTEMTDYGSKLTPSMCGRLWYQVLCPEITPEDVVEFHFINPHQHGNEQGYKEVLETLYLTPLDNTILEEFLGVYTKPFEKIGFAVLVIGIMILGAALSASISRRGPYKNLIYLGCITIFMGGYIIFDVITIFLLSELLVVKTYGRQLCMMMAAFFLELLVHDDMTGKRKTVAAITMYFSAIVNVVIMILVLTEKMLMFDTQYYWAFAQTIICLVLIGTCLFELIKNKKAQKLNCAIYIVMLAAISVDLTEVLYSRFFPAICSKTVFLFALVIYLIRGAIGIINGYNATIKNKKLEEELESSRIAIMISQIQPHFLYNSLTSIMYLCDKDPKQAKSAIADFADYLRGNLASLREKNLITIESELKHIEGYLRLEKLRFQDALEVEYDINSVDFMVPALSIQPLVENSVKHGLGRKTGGGKVTIHTSETDSEFIVRVIDNGTGFVEGEYASENGSHIGLENIKKRLEKIMGARLVIESEVGKGTTASILIPKNSYNYN